MRWLAQLQAAPTCQWINPTDFSSKIATPARLCHSIIHFLKESDIVIDAVHGVPGAESRRRSEHSELSLAAKSSTDVNMFLEVGCARCTSHPFSVLASEHELAFVVSPR